ncbi:C4b-binding protein-like [Gastrophryne carolinensis]
MVLHPHEAVQDVPRLIASVLEMRDRGRHTTTYPVVVSQNYNLLEEHSNDYEYWKTEYVPTEEDWAREVDRIGEMEELTATVQDNEERTRLLWTPWYVFRSPAARPASLSAPESLGFGIRTMGLDQPLEDSSMMPNSNMRFTSEEIASLRASDIFKMTFISYTFRCICILFLCALSLFLGAQGDCGPPPTIPNTKNVTETSGVPGQSIVYTCDTDYYEIPGKSNAITCQDDGMWTTIPEFCTKACGVPERLEFAEPTGGALLVNIFYPGQNVTYQCRPGYRRVFGTKNVVFCLDDFTWSKPETFCQLRSCGNPGEPENGHFEATEFTFGSRVNYNCNEGYVMKSSRPYRDCQADGKWSNAVPVCEAVVCSAPEKSTDGSYDPQKDEYFYLDSVTFSCPRHLELIGPSSIACSATGKWSDSIPKCIAVNCEDPVVPHSTRGSGFVGPYRLNFAISFNCNEGYVLDGQSIIKCNASSQWEPGVPKCTKLVSCVDPIVEHSTRRPGSVGPYTPGSTVTFECKAGFALSGQNSVTCNVNGQWEPALPKCLAKSVNCKDPIVEHSIMLPGDVGPYTPGSSVTFECQDGFNLHGSSAVTCNMDGQWKPDLPKCEKSKPNIGLIVGIVVGVVVGLIFIIIILFKYLKRQKKRGKPQPDALNVQYSNCSS